MNRHVPMMCRGDPFFRDLEKDFWGERPVYARGNATRACAPETVGPSRLFDQHFGGSLDASSPAPTSSLYHRSRRPPLDRSGVATLHNSKDSFTVSIEVPQFAPEEMHVRVSDEGRSLEVEGRHEGRDDEHGTVSRHFVRKYVLPSDAVLDLVSSSLSPDGVLTVDVPRRPPPPPQPAERDVPISKVDKKAA